MQPAKATTFGQWALAYLNGFLRATETIEHYYDTYNICPLGACESYGTSWPLDREYTAQLLGFEKVWEIPQDVISSRGFAQLGYLTGMRDICLVTSKMAQDLMLFDTFEYGLVSLGNEVAQRMHPITGSSVMAQKKNPDVLELIRSTSAQLSGFTGILTGVLTALPMGYNRDSREAKEYMDLGISKTSDMIKTLNQVVNTLQIDENRGMSLVVANYSQTTDLADFISQKSGIGYRLVYKAVGQVVDDAINNGKLLSEITVQDLQNKFTELGLGVMNVSKEEIIKAINPQISIGKRVHIGGASSTSMNVGFINAEKSIENHSKWIDNKQNQIENSKKLINETIKKVLSE